MAAALARSRKRLLAGMAVSVLAVSAAVFGVAGSASAFTDPDVSGCLEFSHSRPFFGTTQKLVATNTCAVGPFGFRIHNWSALSVFGGEWTPCLQADAHKTTGWQWPKGRSSYQIISC